MTDYEREKLNIYSEAISSYYEELLKIKKDAETQKLREYSWYVGELLELKDKDARR